MDRGSCTCRHMTCSPPPRSSGSSRWRRCWPGCRHAATFVAWSKQGRPSGAPLPRCASREWRPGPPLGELMSKRLDDLDLVAFMVDGVHFGEHTCVVALGIGIDGTKHPLAVLAEIKNRGVRDVLMVVCDGLTGLPDA